jgi:hypothetical protein
LLTAHGYGKRFIVRADELLTAFMQLESAIRSATLGKSACYENLPPDRAAKPYQDHDCLPLGKTFSVNRRSRRLKAIKLMR